MSSDEFAIGTPSTLACQGSRWRSILRYESLRHYHKSVSEPSPPGVNLS